ncbi:C2H2 type zinc finger domain-containingprotein [Purpureocillium lilacinum]|uniref:C2H2 type zinc finger domain-containingprotein n=1 Tax=Purpureocillium lilacinum TaxID=33203 RepID=A0A179GAI3_PURLI|nr:C2H2 type zinc finger domain-containingprotein [Purpureocillium lilacinum]OAQ74825.1 C2H2 type zinc finger domain-containingprotein [Purpureocillium lilacinum]OAQ82935.1 C2H2 type zinc finger domain-containingprotein [Purpureocillium lilacinum]
MPVDHSGYSESWPIHIFNAASRKSSKGPKVWPRADNFRSHLHRAHKITLTADDDHKDFIYRPPEDKINLKGVGSFHVAVDARPPYLQDSPGLSGQATSLDHHFGDGQLNSLQETSVGIDPSIFRSPSLVKPTAASNGDDEDELVEPMNMGSLDTQSIGDYDLQTSPDFDVESPEYDQQACPDHAAGTPAPTLPEPLEKPSPQPERHELSIDRLGPSECTQPGLEDHRADLALPQRCRRGPDFSAIVELLKAMAHGADRNKEEIVSLLTAVPTEDLQTALRARGQDTGDACQSEDDPSNRPECNDCGKTFSRQCELKKHIKRHQKPYGCTFKQCSKRFGSKNDWKRHESSQHYELETWNCNKLNCNKTCQRRESFKNHLQKDHDVKGAEEIEEMLEKCRMGRHCGPRFWCGFCVEIIEISAIERGGNSWTKRCDHIDNHLFGKEGLEKKDISEWRYQEDEQDAIKEVDFLAVPGSDVDMAGGKKRKSTEDIDVRPFKKPSGDETYMWNCCFCDTTMNFKTSPSCVECGHVRCSTNCMVERVETSDDQMAAMEGEEAAVAGDDMPRT